MKTSQALKFSLQAVSIFFVLGIVMSYKLWISQRLFPVVPALDFLPILPKPIDLIFAATLVGTLSWNVVKPNKWSIRISVGVLLVLGLLDQMRWQPWVYLYLLMLIGFVVIDISRVKKEGKVLLSYLQIILIGVYFYSGFHKFNQSFLDVVYPMIMSDFLGVTNQVFIEGTKFLGILIPVIEVLIAVGLFTKKFRKIAAVFAWGTHLFIILYLTIGLQHNYVVLPWNVLMMVMVYLLFFKQENKILLRPKTNKGLIIAGIILVWFLPFWNVLGFWNHYFSFNLYSENLEDLYVGMDQATFDALDAEIKAHVILPEQENASPTLNVGGWAFEELNVPVIPEARVTNAISKKLCKSDMGANGTLSFNLFKRGKEPKLLERYGCNKFRRKN